MKTIFSVNKYFPLNSTIDCYSRIIIKISFNLSLAKQDKNEETEKDEKVYDMGTDRFVMRWILPDWNFWGHNDDEIHRTSEEKKNPPMREE